MKRRELTSEDFKRSTRLAAELRELRKQQGRTAHWVADQIGISGAYLCDLENGRRCFSRRLEVKYLRALGFTRKPTFT